MKDSKFENKKDFFFLNFRLAVLKKSLERWSLACWGDWTFLNCVVLKNLKVNSELWVLRCFHVGRALPVTEESYKRWVEFPGKGRALREYWGKRAWDERLITAYQFLLHLEGGDIDQLAEDSQGKSERLNDVATEQGDNSLWYKELPVLIFVPNCCPEFLVAWVSRKRVQQLAEEYAPELPPRT